jgi:hypothetical protein
MDVLSEIIEKISGMETDDLRTLNNQVVAILRSRERAKQRQAAVQFQVGDSVMFHTRNRGSKVGKVTGFNKTTISVRVAAKEDFRSLPENWKVAPSLLQKVG